MTLQIPYKGKVRLTSPFGERVLNGATEVHNGIDLVGDDNKTLYAPCAGTIGFAGQVAEGDGSLTWQWGNYVRIDTDDGYSVYMCHMSELWCGTGQVVEAGTVLGVEGQTGYSFGSHCHFEVRYNGTAVNPCSLLGIDNSEGVIQDETPTEVTIAPIETPTTPTETPTTPTWSEAVTWAVDKGYLKGYSDTSVDLQLDKEVSARELITLVYRIINGEGLTRRQVVEIAYNILKG